MEKSNILEWSIWIVVDIGVAEKQESTARHATR